MATVSFWKLQLPAQRREEKEAVGGQEQGERELAQKPVQKQGLLERLHANPRVPVAEPGLANEATDEAPPEPDKPVILETIRPVHQDHFIPCQVQKKKQRHHHLCAEKQLTERRPPEGQGHISGEVEAQEQRTGPAEAQEQNLVRRDSKEQKLSLGEAGERMLGVAEVREQSFRPAEALEWRSSPKEMEERRPQLSESQQWERSSGKAQERNGKPVEPQEQTSGGCEMRECTLSPGEESKESSRESKTEQRLMQRKSRENSGLLETQRCKVSPRDFQQPSSGVMEAAEMRSREMNPGEAGKKSSRQMEGQKWRLNSGKALERSPGRSEAQEQKPVSSGSGDKKLGLPGVEAGEGRTEAAREEARDGGKMVSSVTKPLLPKEIVTRNSRPQHPLPLSMSPLPPAPPTPQNPRLTHLFYEIKSGSRVGAPCHSRHTFTVNPRVNLGSRPPAAPALPEPQIPGPGKKKYPTAEEILVLGGYLHLGRSCLAKKSPERCHKQLKISFNESALETIYYYPSEHSVLEELGL